jgi:hypothetical protein
LHYSFCLISADWPPHFRSTGAFYSRIIPEESYTIKAFYGFNWYGSKLRQAFCLLQISHIRKWIPNTESPCKLWVTRSRRQSWIIHPKVNLKD